MRRFWHYFSPHGRCYYSCCYLFRLFVTQPDPVRLLRQCIEQLETMQKDTDIDVQLERFSAYGLRNLVDFD